MTTKEKIFASALSLFSEKGFDGVSVREIAKDVGIKESSIYNHYAGKKAIIDEVCARFVRTFGLSRPPLAKVAGLPGEMRPRDIFKYLIFSYGREIDVQTTQMAKTIFSEQFRNEKARLIFTDQIIRKNVQYYEELLTFLEENKRIRKCDKHIAATVFNNEQIALSFQYAHCTSDGERAQVAKLMAESAEYLIGPLEAEPEGSA